MSAPATISELLRWAAPHALPMSSIDQYVPAIRPADQWGYILGWTGQIATSGKWRGRHCMDCNGLFEYFLGNDTGNKHNTFSRVNYAEWCKGFNGKDMFLMPQQPGTAIFHQGASIIEHVGCLYKKFGPAPTDWIVLEAANGNKGVILSKFGSQWNRWGQMRRMFRYDLPELIAKCPYKEPTAHPAYGQQNSDAVRWLQWMLRDMGFAPGAVDGDFGPLTQAAVKRAQQRWKLSQTGVVDDVTRAYVKGRQALPQVWTNPYKEPVRPPQAGENGDGVRWVQWHLERIGYQLPNGGIDGDFRTETSNAVHTLQRAHGLPVGPVTAETMRALKTA